MKTKRQAKILELIKKNNIETQEELSDYLEREEYQMVKRRYSGFFGTDLEILLKGLKTTFRQSSES